MIQKNADESPDCPTPPEVFSFREGTSASASGLVQLDAPNVSPDCPEATSASRAKDRIHPACFPNMIQKNADESPDCPTPPEVFSYRDHKSDSAAGLVQLQFATGNAGDEDLG